MLYLALILILVPCVVLAVLSGRAKRPRDLGLCYGRLAACSIYPSCVSSQADGPRHAIAPLVFSGSRDAALARLLQVLRARPRTRIVAQQDAYIHAESWSLVFRFVDDVEFFVDDAAKVIHVRSASRVGRADFGANRQRVEDIRAAFELAGQSAVAANAERG
jgi:uncharacterized protein (DUF1499 family)